ncbi:MAG: hypothetical protein HYU86_01180 [Chloroflexi bacterium]|nr:hypothetical protein [Chloroflexota bacterium]
MGATRMVLRDLIGGRFRHKAPYVIIGVLLLGVMALSAWVVWSDLSHRKGEREEESAETRFVPAFMLEELGRATWRVGEVAPNKGGTVYTAKVVDGQGGTIFDLRVSAVSGQLLPQGMEQEIGPAASTPLDAEALRTRVSAVLPQLALGQAKTKEGGAFADVALTYQSQPVATLKVNPLAKTIIPKGEKPPSENKSPQTPEGKKARVVPGNLVQPLGWLATMVAIVSTLYYSWRRAQSAIIRESEGIAKSAAIRRLRGLLRWHEVFGFLALGLGFLHLLNFWNKLQVSTSWLLFFMMGTVVLSGMFRDTMGRYPVVRTYWRSFHIPYTLLFFAVLAVHVLMKVHVFGGD